MPVWTTVDSRQARNFLNKALASHPALRPLYDPALTMLDASRDNSNGEWAGMAASFATGFEDGARAAGAKAAGKEFSHWIPNRFGGRGYEYIQW